MAEYISLEIRMSQYEPEVSMETLTQFDSMVPHNTIKIIKPYIKGSIHFIFNGNVARRLLLDGLNGRLSMHISKREQEHVAVFEVEVRNSRLSFAQIYFWGNLHNTFGRLRFLNTTLRFSHIITSNYGVWSFLFKNCSFTSHLILKAYHVQYFSILESTINFTDNCKIIGCLLEITGELEFQTEKNHFFNSSYPIVRIQNSLIKGGSDLALDFTDVDLIIAESTFNITSYKLQSGHLINLNSKYHWSTVELKNTTITFTALVYEITYIGVMALSARVWRIKDSQIVCPVGMKVTETIPTNYYEKRFYYCQQNCDSNAYTFQNSSMVLHGKFFNSMSSFIYDGEIKNTLLNLPEPICKLCPIGANCSSTIKALPNYWGLRNEKDDVTMVRCPDGYCCQTIDSCEEIDSCNSNRSGRLCGGCKKNFTESLFDPTCVLNDKCHTGLIMMLYISALLVMVWD